MAIAQMTCYSGDTTTWPITITANGVPYDITGHTLSWIISKDQTALKKLQVDVTAHTDPEHGISSFTLTPINIEDIGGPGRYWITCVDVDAVLPTVGHEVTRAVTQLIIHDRIQRG